MHRSAVVTGATRGIGRAVAERLAKDGFSVLAVGTSDFLDADKIPARYCRADISNADDRVRIVRTALDAFGGIDLLVNNAGVAPKVRADILEMTEESFDRVLSINLRGAFFLTQLVARAMLAHSAPGRMIINVSSMSAYVSSVSRGEYCISKAGVSMATKLFADRLAGEGINVYEIRPGVIETDMTSMVQDKYDALISGGLTPIARWGQPDDIARAVSAIASGAFPFSTGEVFNIDGGFHLQRL